MAKGAFVKKEYTFKSNGRNIILEQFFDGLDYKLIVRIDAHVIMSVTFSYETKLSYTHERIKPIILEDTLLTALEETLTKRSLSIPTGQIRSEIKAFLFDFTN
jgi:hypothetical protein